MCWGGISACGMCVQCMCMCVVVGYVCACYVCGVSGVCLLCVWCACVISVYAICGVCVCVFLYVCEVFDGHSPSILKEFLCHLRLSLCCLS